MKPAWPPFPGSQSSSSRTPHAPPPEWEYSLSPFPPPPSDAALHVLLGGGGWPAGKVDLGADGGERGAWRRAKRGVRGVQVFP